MERGAIEDRHTEEIVGGQNRVRDDAAGVDEKALVAGFTFVHPEVKLVEVDCVAERRIGLVPKIFHQ